MPTDCVSIVRLPQVPLGDRKEVVAKFSVAWPAIQWERLDAERIDGRLKTESFTLDLTVSFKPGYYGATLGRDPEGIYFDEDLIAKIQALCDENG